MLKAAHSTRGSIKDQSMNNQYTPIPALDLLPSEARDLPPEIWSKIFLELPRPTFRTTFTPTQVNRYWRTVAISTPIFWVDIHAYLKEGNRHVVEKVEAWITRSGTLPISLSLSTPSRDKSGQVHQAILRLAEQSHRWRSVRLYMPTTMLSSLQGARDRLPILESLSILRPFPGGMVDTLDIFRNAPQLRTLSLGYQVCEPMLELPWKQITRCNLGIGLSISECLLNLQVAAGLVFLELGPAHRNANLHVLPTIYLPELKELKLTGYWDDLLNHTDSLSLPSLQTLELESSYVNLELTQFGNLLARTSTTLRRLLMKSSENLTTSDELIAWLELCPMLSELELGNAPSHGADPVMLKHMTHTTQRAEKCCLLPHLVSFKVSIHNNFTFQSFADMIESRWRSYGTHCGAINHQPIDRIKEAQLCRLPDYSARDEPRNGEEPAAFALLRRMRDEGLRIYAMDYEGTDVELEGYGFRSRLSTLATESDR